MFGRDRLSRAASRPFCMQLKKWRFCKNSRRSRGHFQTAARADRRGLSGCRKGLPGRLALAGNPSASLCLSRVNSVTSQPSSRSIELRRSKRAEVRLARRKWEFAQFSPGAEMLTQEEITQKKSMDDKIAELEAKRAELELGGGKERIDRQHASGKLTARERVDRLVDKGSFEEIGLFCAAPRHVLRHGREGTARRRRGDGMRDRSTDGWCTWRARILRWQAARRARRTATKWPR